MKKEKKPVGRTKEHPMILTVPEMIFTFLSIPFCIMSSYGLASGSADEFVKALQLAFLMIGLMRLFRALGNRYRKPAPALKGLDLAATGIMILCVIMLQLKRANVQRRMAQAFQNVVVSHLPSSILKIWVRKFTHKGSISLRHVSSFLRLAL